MFTFNLSNALVNDLSFARSDSIRSFMYVCVYRQSLFLPILPASMSWTTQCTAPYIIGIHSSVFTTLNMEELGDVVIVNIDERKLDTQYEDLNRFPKFLTRSMKKAIQQSSQIAGDHLARVFLRAMAYAIGKFMRLPRKESNDDLGGYAGGFVIRNEKLDFDRDLYLQQFVGSSMFPFMSSVAQTQMFEQVCEDMEEGSHVLFGSL